MNSTTHLDEIDAWQAADVLFDVAIDALTLEQRKRALNQRIVFAQADGGVRILWVDGKPRLTATVVRDELNRSVLMVQE